MRDKIKKSWKFTRSVIPVAFLLASTAQLALSAEPKYLRVGEVRGEVCGKIFGIICSLSKVDGIKADNGDLYNIADQWEDVSRYRPHENKKDERCWVNTGRGQPFDLWEFGKSFFYDYEFFRFKDDDSIEEIEPKYITFPCVRLEDGR